MMPRHAAHLARRTALSEGIAALSAKPVLHGDNGSTLKATTVLAMLHWLGIKPSYSRPRVSDDNPYAEALFRTAKYRPEFPVSGFETSPPQGLGPLTSCVGTTSTTGTAAFATSAPINVIPAPTARSSRLGTPCTSKLENATRPAGHATLGTGRQSKSSP